MADVTERLSAALADRYRITGRLGEGGMATVYLAEDLKHDRKVALKVLRPELAAVLGADRFVQEIKTTAQLQHPHILPLYDSGNTTAAQGGGTEFLYYVMPYIQGETLRDKLNREGQLGIDEAVKITTEVADALQYAHMQGVIHRDIKPENILLHNSRAIVADFGIALAVSAAAGGRMTETGLSLGTPHYMSPEQATADRHITHRSDIYSLGSMLYEMLTGDPPHTGSSAQAIIMKIVTDDARPVRELRKSVPPHVAAAVARAVEKLSADRFDSARAFSDALNNPARAPAAATFGPSSRRFVVPALSVVIVLTAVVAAWGWLRPTRARSVARYATSLSTSGAPDGITLRVETAFSPDGASLVFRHPLTGPGQLYIKRRDEVTMRPLVGTEGGSGPFFSPDGAWIGFFANGQMRKVPVTGGASLTLAESVDPTYNQGAWLSDGSIVLYDLTTHTLRRLRSGDVKAQVIVSPAKLGGRYPWLPSALPDARGILFTAHLTNCVGPVSCRPSRVYAYDARKDTILELFKDAVGAWYVPTGHVLYLTSAGTLMAARWDNTTLSATAKAVPILDGIQAPGFVVSREGTALYLLGAPEFAPGPKPNAALVWVDRNGRIEPVDSSWQVNTGGFYNRADLPTGWGVALSPDGRRIALSLLTELGTDIWIKQLPKGPLSRLTLDPAIDRAPMWTDEGRAISFLSDRTIPPQTTRQTGRFGLWQQSVDGTGEPKLLWGKDAPTDGFSSPNGRWVVLGATGASSDGDVLAAQPGVDSVARQIVTTRYDEGGSVLSPDSRWLAYVSNEQGAYEVFVRPFPDASGGKWQVSTGGGSAPLWAHNGRELFYVRGKSMFVVRISPGPPFVAEPPRVLFAIPDRVRSGSLAQGTFAITPDDQRFLMVRDRSWEDMAGRPTMVVVENFFDELRAKLKQ
ncbi:protein kinase domain-containing protein [Gemmatimonas sp.]|uniref:protein kinase domain-containing protein n=1 Tax=Gemmatimonas sp. TaxID=1962908 RepID=UPI003982DB63